MNSLNNYTPHKKLFRRSNLEELMRWAGHVARMGEWRGAHRVLVAKPEENIPLGSPMRRWVDNIKMDLQEMGWGMDWIDLALYTDRWPALVNAVMNVRVL
jgi:hypothetical protein